MTRIALLGAALAALAFPALAETAAPATKGYLVSEAVLKDIAKYLQGRPYSEVTDLLNRLQADLDHQPKPPEPPKQAEPAKAPDAPQ